MHPDDRARPRPAGDDLPGTGAQRGGSFPSCCDSDLVPGHMPGCRGPPRPPPIPSRVSVRIVTGMHNVDDLVDARASARESARQYRLIAENASDIVTLVAPDGVLQWISPSVTRILGWGPDELIGTRPWSLVHPDDREAAAQSFAEASVPGTAPPPIQLRFRCADGGYVWLSTNGSRAEHGRFLVQLPPRGGSGSRRARAQRVRATISTVGRELPRCRLLPRHQGDHPVGVAVDRDLCSATSRMNCSVSSAGC